MTQQPTTPTVLTFPNLEDHYLQRHPRLTATNAHAETTAHACAQTWGTVVADMIRTMLPNAARLTFVHDDRDEIDLLVIQDSHGRVLWGNADLADDEHPWFSSWLRVEVPATTFDTDTQREL